MGRPTLEEFKEHLSYGPITCEDGSEVVFTLEHDESGVLPGEWKLAFDDMVLLPVDKDKPEDDPVPCRLFWTPEEAFEAIELIFFGEDEDTKQTEENED